MRVLGLWPPVLSLLQPSHAPSLRQMAAWVCSTAVQNNAQAQQHLMEAGGLAKLLAAAREDVDEGVCAKAVSALNSTLHNNAPGQAQFAALEGWQTILTLAARGGNVMRKSLFMMATVLLEEGASARARIPNLQQSLHTLVNHTDLDDEMREHCHRLLAL